MTGSQALVPISQNEEEVVPPSVSPVSEVDPPVLMDPLGIPSGTPIVAEGDRPGENSSLRQHQTRTLDE